MNEQISMALVKAQKGFAPALKTNTNPHFRSKYVGLDGCVEAVIDSLNENGIFLMQQNHECNDGVIVETIFIHESGEQISAGKLHVPAGKFDAQGFGSALTYARRYSLMAACGIAPEDDDGNAAVAKPPAKPVLVKPDSQQLKKLKEAAKHGTAALQTAWQALTKEDRHELADELPKLKAMAIEWEEAAAVQA